MKCQLTNLVSNNLQKWNDVLIDYGFCAKAFETRMQLLRAYFKLKRRINK